MIKSLHKKKYNNDNIYLMASDKEGNGIWYVSKDYLAK